MTDDATVTCNRCGAATPATNRYCGSCGASLSQDLSPPTVAAAVARGDRLSDSGAIQLRQLLEEATRNDFEIQDELGRGGMAIVYLATEVHLSRRVAIKVLPPDLTYAKGATERFQREAKTAAALDHPNIIPIYRISTGGKPFWYAMKFLEGRSLAEILVDKGLLTVSESVAILEQVANALDYAHQHSVVHRDIKPGNVMIDVNGRVTVTDFGIAKELQQGSGLTGSGAILGTPYYMSPEQCRGGTNVGGAADQYSLAVMTYQMISGQLPFEADSAIDVIHKHVSEAPPPLEKLLPGLGKNVINAVSRAMAKKAEDRFPTVQAFVKALKGSLSAEATLVMDRRPSAVKAVRRSAAEATPAALRMSAKRVAALLVLVGGLVAGVVWLANNSGGPTAEIAPQSAPPGIGAASTAQQPADSSPPPTVSPASRNGAARPGPATRAAGSETARRTPANPPTVRQSTSPATGRTPTTPAPGPSAVAGTPSAAPARAPANPPAPAGAATRRGFVRISISNSYATISIGGRTVPDRRGFADSLPAGSYTATFTRDGWETETRAVTVRAGQETVLSVPMRPRSQP